MNGKKAKALRRALGFAPGEDRSYGGSQPRYVAEMTTTGRVVSRTIPGTKMSQGTRNAYQKVKRNHVLTSAVLNAKPEVAHA